MNSYMDMFNKKMNLIQKKLINDRGFKQFDDFFSVCGSYAAFISVSDIEEQAYVFRASAQTVREAWEKAKSNALEFICEENFNPLWIKADITMKGEKQSLSEVITKFSKGYGQFFRRGISFDEKLDAALIEAEINANALLDYKGKKIEIDVLNKYLEENDLKALAELPQNVILFDCKSVFCDEKNNVYELYAEGRNAGRRKIAGFNKDTALGVIMSSSEYLAIQIDEEGQFIYGYYPTVPEIIPGYNIMRHASSIWSLLCAYRITSDKITLNQAERAIDYMIRNMAYKYPQREDRENVLYLFEATKHEVKIGGNAVAIIVLTEYMNIVGTYKYKKIATELGNGILELFDERNGSFFHVLKYPSLAPRDRFRTVYYDGETVFALSRLYGLTKEQRFLDVAKQATDRFIRRNYEQYADHWVAYSINELTKYVPEEKYFKFGLKNVRDNLEKIYKTPTTYHTYLELLCVSFEMVCRMKEQNLKCSGLEDFDEKKLVKTIFHRAEYMLNGYGYPEYVMYFTQPENYLGAFFIRHDNYRIRIDDVQHFCGAYYALYRNYEKLDALRD